uniref:HAD hydrolase-like protein n=1 Tax=Listeria monocytogenes TaxID=1639 RepID=UPI003D35079A
DEVYHRVVRGEMPKAEMHVYRITQALSDFDYQITKKEAETFQHAYEQNQRKIELSPGIKEILAWAKKNEITMGIITNKEKTQIYLTITDFLWDESIDLAERIVHQAIDTRQIEVLPMLTEVIQKLPVAFDKLNVTTHPETLKALKEENTGTKYD